MNSKIFVIFSSFVLLAWLGISFFNEIAPSKAHPSAHTSPSKEEPTFAGNPTTDKP
jgi:hypothetical protein